MLKIFTMIFKREKFIILAIRPAKNNEKSPMAAEQIFATLHGMLQPFFSVKFLNGFFHKKVSFEIFNSGGHICFYVCCPAGLQHAIEEQIYAQYSWVEIEKIPNDMFEKSFPYALGVEMALTDPDIYPIKRYAQFEDKKAKIALDPLAAMTATLTLSSTRFAAVVSTPSASLRPAFAKASAGFGELRRGGDFLTPPSAGSDENVGIQIVVRPLKEKWRRIFVKCVRIMKKGIFMNIETLQKLYAKAFCVRSRLIKFIFFPLYAFFWFQGLFANTSVIGKSFAAHGSEIEEQISKFHEKETSMVAAIDKVGKLLYEVNIRILYLSEAKNKHQAFSKLQEICGSFKQFHIPHLNGFKIKKLVNHHTAYKRYKMRAMHKPFVLNIEELATIYHLPNMTVTTPNIDWVLSKSFEPPRDLPTEKNSPANELTLLGKTTFRSDGRAFGIKNADRRKHVYIIGKTGMGKSTLLENMIFSDIYAGRGVGVIDPHGDLADTLLKGIPSNRTNDVVVFDPSDTDFPIAFNMLQHDTASLNTLICSGCIGVFKKIYAESWGPRLEHILRNTLLALLEYPNTTMLGIPRLLQDNEFRRRVVRKISDPVVKNFWLHEFEKMDPRLRVEAISPILNKVGQFLSSPIIRNIVGQPQSRLDLRFVMDQKKIIIINLSKGKIGEDTANLIGSLLITQFQLDAMSRAALPEEDRVDFYLYIDEFQNFATDAFLSILSEARKYRLNLTLAHQYIAQIPENLQYAIFGNVGSVISFQVGFDDAQSLTSQFYGLANRDSQQQSNEILPNDFVSLKKHNAYAKLSINGVPSQTFSFCTFPPLLRESPDCVKNANRREKIIQLSRERYAVERQKVEDRIRRWSDGV